MPGDEDQPRPGTVVAAAVVTWVCSGLVSAFVLLGFLVVLGVGEPAEEALLPQGSSPRALQVAVTTVVLWSVVASWLAWELRRRAAWARTALAVSSLGVALLSAATLQFVAPVFTLLAAVTVLVLLYSGGAGQWVRAREARPRGKRVKPRGRPARSRGKRAKPRR